MKIQRVSIVDLVRILTDIKSEGYEYATLDIVESGEAHTITINPCRPQEVKNIINKSFNIDGFLSQIPSGSKGSEKEVS